MNTCISENEVGSRALFQPETGSAARVAQLVVRCEYRWDFHVLSSLFAVQILVGPGTILPSQQKGLRSRSFRSDYELAFVGRLGGGRPL
jgi:hypothetical protein